MKQSYLILLAFFLVPAISMAAEPLTLDEAVTTALAKHPLAAEARAGVEASDARLGKARAARYPQISLNADWSRGDSYLTALGQIKTVEVASTTVNLRQTIHDFGRTAGAVQSARGEREASEHALATTRADIVLRVKSAFYLVLAAQKEVEAARSTLSVREDLLKQAREFFEQGVRSKVEVARAEAAFFAARSTLIRAESNRDLARVELANAMGGDSLGERGVTEPPTTVPHGEELAPLKEEAFRAVPELKELQSRKLAAEGALGAARAGHFPILSATASYGYADKEIPPDGKVWTLGVNLTMPIFSGFSTVEQVREATASLGAADARIANLRLQVGRDVEAAWLDEKAAVARVAATEKELEAAKESQSLALERYREGVGSIIEATDSQAQALNAETAHIRAVYDRNVAVARLERAIGR